MFAALFRSCQEHPVITGWLGSITTLSASAVSMLQQLELIFRVASAGLGMLAGALTLVITYWKAREWLEEKAEARRRKREEGR